MGGGKFLGLERTLLALFVASGFAGLIYQAIWSHYLGLTLGHAAYAQTLVLGIFMGGMALGAWLVGQFGGGWRKLVLAYAWVELAIGLAGLAFHVAFVAYTDFSQGTVYPALSGGAAVRAWQWGSAALLIAPQSILLGMTFPLMSGGYLRIAPRADGEILGGLYFSNSLGAAVGALVATFVLLPWVGMPGAVMVAGVINIAVGLGAWQVSRRAEFAVSPAAGSDLAPAAPEDAASCARARSGGKSVENSPESSDTTSNSAAGTTAPAGFYRLMLVAAGITGASSFVYEIGWVRLLNQALGTTVHSFELMLSAFILGLAFGGLWIRRRSRKIVDVVAYAGYAQILMGIAALVSIPVFSQSFRWVGAMVGALPRTDDGYLLFSLGSGAIALLVMFPAAFFAGMTLPLFTMALLRRGRGESSIGRIYAANTLGAIVGVVLAVHVLIPVMGLRLAVTVAALADILLGLVLLRGEARASSRAFIPVVVTALLVLALSLSLGRLDPLALASGVFRHGNARLADQAEVHFLRDGKTATIAVFSQGSVGTIATNGKPDASLEMHPGRPALDDEVTMLMAAALPLAIHPAAEDIAIIGWGSGLTTHTILGSSVPRLVDSVEIERAMYEGARLFGPRVERAYSDPRSHIRIDDARTYFSTGHKRYDVIISEPSNPWVSGVSSLFTRQFYRFLGNHLQDDGILVQWLQSYELDDSLLSTMLAALVSEFPHVEVYLTNSADMLFVASRSPLPRLDAARIRDTELRAELARVGLAGQGDYEARLLGTERLLKPLVELVGAVPHSDYHPVVALKAPAARFMGAVARRPIDIAYLGMPILEFTDRRLPVRTALPIVYSATSTGSENHVVARQVRKTLLAGAVDPELARLDASVTGSVEALLTLTGEGAAGTKAWYQRVSEAAELTISRLPAEDLAGVWIDPVWIDVGASPEAVQRVMRAYSAAARRSSVDMLAGGLAALEALDPDAPQLLRQQMLMIALLGASREGDAKRVREVEMTHGRDVAAQGTYGVARAYLLAWAGLQEAE